MRAITIFLLLFMKSGNTIAGGFSTWSHPTPGFNTLFSDDGTKGTRIFCGNEPYIDMNQPKVTNLVEWYYKPGYIIGTFQDADTVGKSGNESRYFLFAEATCEITIFSDKGSWETALMDKKLLPVFWRRVHNNETELDAMWIGGDPILYIFIFIVFAFAIVNLLVFTLSRFRRGKNFAFASSCICILSAIVYWLNFYLYSF
jgi:hypothetical protein